MKDVARIVRKHIDAHFPEKNSLNESFQSHLISQFLKKSMQIAAERKKDMQIAFIANGKLFRIYMLDDKGKYSKAASYSVPLETITDDDLQDKHILRLMELGKLFRTDKPNTELIVKNTKERKLAALVLIEDNTHKAPFYNTKEIPAMTLLINPSGCDKIAKMLKKYNDRQEQKKFIPGKFTDKELRGIDYKMMYSQIRKEYKEYKKEFGDKLALQMTETINNLSKNENFQAVMKKEYGSGTTKQNMQAYLYAFLLDQKDTFGFVSWMKKNKKFIELYNRFHPGKEIE